MIVLYSTIFVRVMDSSYPSQDGGGERGKGYAVEVHATGKLQRYIYGGRERGKGYAVEVHATGKLQRYIYGECSQIVR